MTIQTRIDELKNKIKRLDNEITPTQKLETCMILPAWDLRVLEAELKGLEEGYALAKAEFKNELTEGNAYAEGSLEGFRLGRAEGIKSERERILKIVDKECLITEANCNCPNGFEYSNCWHRVQVFKELKQQISDNSPQQNYSGEKNTPRSVEGKKLEGK